MSTRFHGEFEYEVEVNKIQKWGTFNFEAKVETFIRRLPNGKNQLLQPLQLGFHVHHGATRADAEAKVDAEVERWIAAQSGGPDSIS